MVNKKLGRGTPQRAVNGGLDDYYTNPEYAFYCCEVVRRETYRFNIEQIVEPSAGNGAFYEGMRLLSRNGNRELLMYDLCPKSDLIREANFFDVPLKRNTIVLGNPPFGFSANLAVKFFNHAADFKVKIIAFILPKTFKKLSIHNKLNKHYHLIYEEDCPKNSFLLDDNEYDVPCVFQIWKYSDKERVMKSWSIDNKWIEFTTPDKAEFALRRVGGRAGKILEGDMNSFSKTSTYFCKEKVKGAKKALESIDFTSIVNSTAGVRSLSKSEIHEQLNKYFEE